jgi:hypothetical protein
MAEDTVFIFRVEESSKQAIRRVFIPLASCLVACSLTCSTYSLTQKMKVVCSTEMLAKFTKLHCHMPGDRILHVRNLLMLFIT